MQHPGVEAVVSICRALAVTEAEHVRGEHPVILGQLRHDQAPVGPGGDARAGAVDQQQRKAAALLQQVGAPACGEDLATQLGA